MPDNNDEQVVPPNDAERFKILVAGVADYAIYMLTTSGIVSSWNAGAQRFKGYIESEIIGQHFSVFYTEKDRAAGVPQRALQTVLSEGRFEDEGWRVRKDGTTFWASVVIDPVRDNTGNLIGFAKITRDITDRKKAADALHASEQQFRLLVQGVTDYAIYMLSADGVVSNWNPGAKRIKGYSDEEVIGTHFSRFYTEEDRARELPAYALQTAKSSGRFESEGWRVRKDGTRFWAHVVIDPIFGELGDLIGFAKITRDVTERREAAAALEQTQLALFQAQKMESIGQLTGGIAHDFNNLLSVVANGVAILQHKLKDPQDIKVLESMERATDRGTALIRQLLTFARRQPTDPKPYNLNEVIRSFESVLRRAAGNMKLDIELNEAIPIADIDAGLFEAAVLNLIVNARDASTDGSVIHLQTSVTSLDEKHINALPAGRYIKVSVIDSGHGIPPDILAKIIEPFFTTKPPGKGTGLGLSQVYGFVKQSKGDLIISSEPGNTVFSLYFPAHSNAEEHSAGQAKAMERALVVDDQPDVLDMAVQLFIMLGYEVVSAQNGEEALKLLQRYPDMAVLFSDVIMPGMNGVELAQKAKALIPNLQILLASGYSGPSLLAQNNNLKDFSFIAKPYKLADIAKQLRNTNLNK